MINMFKSVFPEPVPTTENPSASKGGKDTHLNALRPVLLPNINNNTLMEILEKKGARAEESLGEFMTLVGIQQQYAHLRHQDLKDLPTKLLTTENIKLIAELQFKKQRTKK